MKKKEERGRKTSLLITSHTTGNCKSNAKHSARKEANQKKQN